MTVVLTWSHPMAITKSPNTNDSTTNAMECNLENKSKNKIQTKQEIKKKKKKKKNQN